MSGYEFPLWTNFVWMLGLSGFFLLLFHWLLILFIPLTSVGWKKVDYVWVSLTFLGIIAGVEQNREIYASNYRDLARERAVHHFSEFKGWVAFGHSSTNCRELKSADGSSPSEETRKIQLGYDAQCAWFEELDRLVSELDATMLVQIDLSEIHGPPPLGGNPWAYQVLEESVTRYNAEALAFGELTALAERSDFMGHALALGPFLLAVAVSLRLTKVTGEIRLDLAKARKAADSTPSGGAGAGGS